MDETRSLARGVIESGLLDRATLLSGDDASRTAPAGYELIRFIGRGGGGSVHLARDTRLDRPVAIKFLADAGPADVERFRREARFAARLECPSIVQIYELGETDGEPYIAMQYLDGGNLGEAHLDHAGVARVMREVAAAVGYAHREGIVHRDLKPANILLDRSGRAYVADFGIARDLRGRVGETMSRDGQIMGTPGLMPPEQARGEIQSIDARSDIYAFGATLYHKLTGRYPFAATNVVDALHAVLHDDFPMPRSLDTGIPRALEAIIVRCMQKNRADRYQNMGEVVAALDAFLEGADRPITNAWFARLVAQREDAPAPPGEDVTSLEADWAAGLGIVRELAAWDADLYRVSGSLERSFARLDALRGRLEAVLAERPELAWARFYRGVVLFRGGRLHAAVEEMERAIDRVKDPAGAYFELGRLYLAIYLREHHDAHRHISQIGVDHGLDSARARLEQALVAFQEAQRFEGDLASWHRDYAAAVTHLADGDYDACVAACDAVLDDDPDIEELWKLRGDALRLAGRDPFASYERAVTVRRSYFEAYFAGAEAHLAAGQRVEARAALERAVEIHPRFADALALLAKTCLEEARHGPAPQRLEEGRRLAERALEMTRSSYDAAVTLAEIHLERGRQSAGNDGWYVDALAALESAGACPGCQNRVNLLTAHAHLRHARERRARGESVDDLLGLAVALSRNVLEVEPGNAAWQAVRSEAGAGAT